MPYKRRYKKRTYKRKPRNNYLNRKIKNTVYRSICERKRNEETVNTTVSTAGNVDNLTAIAQGDTDTTRSGCKITVNGIYLKGQFKNHASATTGTRVMISVVKDTQQVADTVIGYTDVYSTTLSAFPLLKDNLYGRFKVIYQKEYIVNMEFSGQQKLIRVQKFIKFKKPLRVFYNGAADTDIQKNGLYLIVWSDQATNTPDVDILATTYFTDP